MVTKKDFKAIAEIIEQGTTEIHDEQYSHFQVLPRNNIVHELADYFAEQNSRFDRQKFLNACGL